MTRLITPSKHEVFIIGSFCLIIATLLQLILIHSVDNKMNNLEFKYKICLNFFDNYRNIEFHKDISNVLHKLEILDSKIFIGLLSKDQKEMDLYNKTEDKIYLFAHYNYMLRKLKKNDQLIVIPDIRTKMDSIYQQSILFDESELSLIEKDSLLICLVELSDEQCIKQISLKRNELKEIENKLNLLNNYKNGFYYSFVMSQILGLLLISYSQIMKDKKETSVLPKSKN